MFQKPRPISQSKNEIENNVIEEQPGQTLSYKIPERRNNSSQSIEGGDTARVQVLYDSNITVPDREKVENGIKRTQKKREIYEELVAKRKRENRR